VRNFGAERLFRGFPAKGLLVQERYFWCRRRCTFIHVCTKIGRSAQKLRVVVNMDSGSCRGVRCLHTPSGAGLYNDSQDFPPHHLRAGVVTTLSNVPSPARALGFVCQSTNRSRGGALTCPRTAWGCSFLADTHRPLIYGPGPFSLITCLFSRPAYSLGQRKGRVDHPPSFLRR
jgi:hypothetical protein